MNTFIAKFEYEINGTIDYRGEKEDYKINNGHMVVSAKDAADAWSKASQMLAKLSDAVDGKSAFIWNMEVLGGSPLYVNYD